MTKENALRAYEHYKKLLEENKFKKDAWKRNAEHAIASILIRHPEFKEAKPIEEVKEKKKISKGD